MGKILPSHKACLFVGILYVDDDCFKKSVKLLESHFGPILSLHRGIPFDVTDYYTDEMGQGIKKGFLFFEKLIEMDSLAEIKIFTNELEEELSGGGDRCVNLDPGYMDMAKVVLATTKDRGHRIYLQRGIYSEVELIYEGNGYQPVPWTYPDYKKEEYRAIFEDARKWFSVMRKKDHDTPG